MKNLAKILVLALLMASVIMFTGCDGDDVPEDAVASYEPVLYAPKSYASEESRHGLDVEGLMRVEVVASSDARDKVNENFRWHPFARYARVTWAGFWATYADPEIMFYENGEPAPYIPRSGALLAMYFGDEYEIAFCNQSASEMIILPNVNYYHYGAGLPGANAMQPRYIIILDNQQSTN